VRKTNERGRERDKDESTPRRVILPGFISDQDIGLGDAMKQVTSYFGLKPCAGCRRRASALNRWVVFTRRRGFNRPRRG
jgi:hypothetical protein